MCLTCARPAIRAGIVEFKNASSEELEIEEVNAHRQSDDERRGGRASGIHCVNLLREIIGTGTR